MSEKYNFTAKIALKGTGSYVKIRQRTWHRPSFNKILCITIYLHPYVTVSKWLKSEYIHTYFPYNNLSFIQFFHFSLYKSGANGVIDIKLGTQVKVELD